MRINFKCYIDIFSFLSNDTNLLTLFAIVLDELVNIIFYESLLFCMSLRKKKTLKMPSGLKGLIIEYIK